MSEKPLVMRYTHDCDQCKPLGQYLHHDIYYCDKACPTVICRYGDEGPEYISGLELDFVDEIRVAILMAKTAGFIDHQH